MKISPVASRYAKALFQFAVEHDIADVVVTDLQTVTKQFEDHPQFHQIFTHPRLQTYEKMQIAKETMKPVIQSDYTWNFIALLIDKKRERELKAIYRIFSVLYDEHQQQLPLEITVAYEISDRLREELVEKVAQLTGKSPRPVVVVDEGILGGVILQFEDKIIDGSIKNRLQQLGTQLRSIPVAQMRGE